MLFVAELVIAALVTLVSIPGISAAAGAGLLFDGINDYATAFPGFELLSEWTVEAWVRPTEPLRTGSCILGVQTLSARNLVTLTSTADQAWSVLFGPEEQDIPYQSWVSTGGQPGSFSASRHHVALAHRVVSDTQSQLHFYINGTLHAKWLTEISALKARPEPSLPALLGACHSVYEARGDTSGRGLRRRSFFGGLMDEVRLWSRSRSQSEIIETMRWTGPPLEWPAPAGITSASAAQVAIQARVAPLRAQYTMDFTTPPRMRDTSGGGRHGLLGTVGDTMDSPAFVPSLFSDELDFGSTYLQLRDKVPSFVTQLEAKYAMDTGVGVSYNGLLVKRLPANPLVELRKQVGAEQVVLKKGDLISGLDFVVEASEIMAHDSFDLQPCRGSQFQDPLVEACAGETVYEYTISSTATTPPFAGPSHALQLLRQGGLLRLPQLASSSVTLEFWVQLSLPLSPHATLLSVDEVQGAGVSPGRPVLDWWLDPFTGGAVLEVCSTVSPGTNSILVPGLVSATPQHLAVSFELVQGSNRSYAVKVYRNCQQVAAATVTMMCSLLDSQQLRSPTLGRRQSPSQPGIEGAQGSDGESAAMYVAELRMWNHPRAAASICKEMSVRLAGNETGLAAYFPITAADTSASIAGLKSVPLTSGLQVLPQVDGADRSSVPVAEAMCDAVADACPDFPRGIGFVFRPSPFDLPPEVVTMHTTAQEPILIPLVAQDLDNYEDRSLESSGAEALHFEIEVVPDKKCGQIYKKGYSVRIRSSEEFEGNLERTIQAEDLPLRFVPFEGASIEEEEAMGGACNTLLQYRALDSQNLKSNHSATVRVQVWRPGVSLLAVEASDPGAADGAADGGDMLRFTFSEPTNEPSVAAYDLLEVVNGSWGTAAPKSRWVDNGSTLLLEFAPGTSSARATISPGTSRFQVRWDAQLQRKGDLKSLPCTDLSATLAGDFGQATCQPGSVFNWATGACDSCPVGTYWNVASSDLGVGRASVQCSLCPGGTYGNVSGALSCTSCPSGRYMPPLSADHSNLDRTACTNSQPGTYIGWERASAEVPCQIGSVAELHGQLECDVCPQHADCEIPDYAQSHAKADPGFFRMSNGSFASCRVPHRCLGRGQCKAGASKIELGCYECEQGWARPGGAMWDEGECSKCPSVQQSVIVSGLVLLGTVLFAMLLARMNIKAAKHSSCLHPFMIKIGLNHLLLMSSFARIEKWQLEPGYGRSADLIHTLFKVFLWDGALPGHLIPVECLFSRLDMDLTARLWLTLAFWTLLPGIVVLCCVLLSMLLFEVGQCFSMCYRCCCSCLMQEESDDEDGPAPLGGRGVSEVSLAGKESVVIPFSSPGSTGNSRKSARNSLASSAIIGSGGGRHQDPFESRIFGIWRSSTWKLGPRRRFKALLQDSSGIILAALVLSYPAVLQQVMSFLRCTSLSGDRDESRLLMAPSIVCGSTDHVQFMAAAWLVLVAWGLGLPAAFYLLVRSHRLKLGSYTCRVKVGMIAAEYEPGFFFWDSIILLRRFAAIVALSLAPSAPFTLRLALLLVIGVMSTALHSYWEPFANRSGLLLDVLEAQALKVFCLMNAVVLFSYSAMAHYGLSFVLTLGVGIVHVIFILRLAVNVLIQVQRSMSDGLVEDHMRDRHSKNILGRYLREKVFLVEASSRRHRAHVWFNPEKRAVEVLPGPAGDDVEDHERLFVAHGLADCLASAITECKFERLSVHHLEFLVRLSFAASAERLACTQFVIDKLEYRALANDDVKKKLQRPSVAPEVQKCWRRAVRKKNVERLIYNNDIFGHGISAGDFQGELIEISSYPRERLENASIAFLQLKGVRGDYHLSPRERLLASQATHMQEAVERLQSRGLTPKSQHERPALTLLPGAPTAAEEAAALEKEAPPLQLTDLESPATLAMSPSRENSPPDHKGSGKPLSLPPGDPVPPLATIASSAVADVEAQGLRPADDELVFLPGSVEEAPAPLAIANTADGAPPLDP